MKACIVGTMNLKHMTLISLYTQIFSKYYILYDLIYIDEYGIEEQCEANQVYIYRHQATSDSRIFRKILYHKSMRDFCKFVKKKLDQGKYDFVVVWREETAVLLYKYLSVKYKNKYSVNIRDIWEGRFRALFYQRLKKAVNKSAFNTISSDGFLRYLPKADYLFVHSANRYLLDGMVEQTMSQDKGNRPIIITNIGTFRNDDYCIMLIDAFANDKRFEIRFYGQGSERIRDYIQAKDYTNIMYHGSFEPQETLNFLKGTDIINCAYGADTIAETSKIPIRFYYAIYLGVPILSTKGTCIQITADRLGIGIALPSDVSKGNFIADQVYNAYNRLNYSKTLERLEKFKKEIDESHIILEKKVLESFHWDERD